MITRRRALLVALVLFLVGVGVIAWTLAGLPPVKYYLRYGLDPYCEPTGERETHEGVEFVEIGPGVFRMGSTYLAEGGDWLGKICAPLGLPWGEHPKPSNEMPVHWVEFRRGFWIATTEITNVQYERHRREGERTAFTEGDSCPVSVTLEQAKLYCEWLSSRTGLSVRLPSESEWEGACRAGSDAEYCYGDDESELGEYAWILENSDGRTHPVGGKRANDWELFDLHGNVWEWCADTYHRTYEDAPPNGTPWLTGGLSFEPGKPQPVIRGGCSVINDAEGCRSATRRFTYQVYRGGGIGFRPAYSNPEDE